MSASTGPADVRASAAIIVAAVIEEGRSLDDVLNKSNAKMNAENNAAEAARNA